MVGYNVAVGIDQKSLDTLLSELYQTLESAGVFPQTFNVSQVNITSVDVNLLAAPTVDLTTGLPAAVAQAVKKQILAHPDVAKLPDAKKTVFADGGLKQIAKSAFTINLPSISATIHYNPLPDGTAQPPTTINGKFSAVATAEVDTQTLPSTSSSLIIQAVSGNLQTADAMINSVVNEGVLPWVCKTINQMDILKPKNLSTIDPLNIQLTVPEPVVQNGVLLAFSAMGAVTPDIPAPFSGWPSGTFVAVDAALVKTAANAEISTIKVPQGNFSWELFTGNYGVTLGPVNDVSIPNDKSGNLTAAIAAGAYFNMTFHTPGKLPNWNFSVAMDGSVGVTAKAEVDNSTLFVRVNNINSVSLIPHFPGIPDFINDVLGDIFGGLDKFLIGLIGPLVSDVLRNFNFSIYKIPEIPVNIPGQKPASFHVQLTNVQTMEVDPAGDALIVASGLPKITS